MTIFGIKFESRKEKEDREYQEFLKQRDEENRIGQIEDDKRWEEILIRRAKGRFNEWLYSKGWLMDFTRHLDIRYTHDDKYSKWAKNEDSEAFVDSLYKQLKEKAISEAIYPEWFDKHLEELKEKVKDNPFQLTENKEFLLWYDKGLLLNNAERTLVERKHFNIENKQ